MQLEEGCLENLGGICSAVLKECAASQSEWEGEEELVALCYGSFVWAGWSASVGLGWLWNVLKMCLRLHWLLLSAKSSAKPVAGECSTRGNALIELSGGGEKWLCKAFLSSCLSGVACVVFWQCWKAKPCVNAATWLSWIWMDLGWALWFLWLQQQQCGFCLSGTRTWTKFRCEPK